MVCQEELKKLLRYNENTGDFTWMVSRGPVSAGDIAGCTAKPSERSSTQYVYISINGKTYLAHRLAWLYVKGDFPEFNIDHRDGCGTNNRFSNLSNVTQSENTKNRRLQKNNSSGLNGVRWDLRSGKWRSFIGCSGKTLGLGYFDSFLDAACARKSAENKYGYHYNHGLPR